MTGVIDNQPVNKNFLNPNGFRFQVRKLPHVNYFTQTVTIPSTTKGEIPIRNPLTEISHPGDQLTFDPFVLRFKVDEDLQNYREILNWMIGLGHPANLYQTRALSAGSPIHKLGSRSTFVSDGTLIVLTSHKNTSHEIIFRDIFPISLTELTFDSTITDVAYLEATATFRYLRYEISDI